MKRTYNKREIIIDTSFDFTKQRIQYQGNGKAPGKRFDRSTHGLCLFIYPSGVKVFCAIKKFSMYNKIKNGPKRTLFIRRSFVWEIIHKEIMLSKSDHRLKSFFKELNYFHIGPKHYLD